MWVKYKIIWVKYKIGISLFLVLIVPLYFFEFFNIPQNLITMILWSIMYAIIVYASEMDCKLCLLPALFFLYLCLLYNQRIITI